MVPIINIVLMLLIGLTMFILPVGLFLYLRTKTKNITGAFFAGMGSFYALQRIIRLPLLSLLFPKFNWYQNMVDGVMNGNIASILLYGLFLGSTAAIFETIGRFVSIKYILKDRLGYYSGISHGIGHGGIEMIILIGINYFVYIYMAFMINNGGFDGMLSGALEQGGQIAYDQMALVRESLINTPSIEFVIALLERLMTLCIHIALSVMIMEGVYNSKNLRNVGFVLLIHTALDMGAVVLSSLGVHYLLVEGFVLIFLIWAIYYIINVRSKFGEAIDPVVADTKYLNSNY